MRALPIERVTENNLTEVFPFKLDSRGGFNTPTIASGYVDYENTEVAYENRPINPAVCKLSLRDRLTTEYIYKVSVDGQIVAKAAQYVISS